MVTTDWILSGAVVVGVLRDRSAREGGEGEGEGEGRKKLCFVAHVMYLY